MVSFAVGITKLLKQAGLKPEYTCGLSLGEYSALYAAEVLSEEDVINLVAFRGKAMEEAVTGREVKMSAVLAMDRDVIAQCCKEAEEALAEEFVEIGGVISTEKNTVQVANYNCPGQIVISGDGKAVDKATELLKEKGAKRVLPLAVSGPFHTSLMKPAGDKLKERFGKYDAIYLTLDIDVLDPAFAPGTGTPVAGGLTSRELIELFAMIIRQLPVKSMDVVEVAPDLDVNNITSWAALRIIHELFSKYSEEQQMYHK